MMQSWFLTFLLLNKSSDSTLHHQELSPNERQEVSVLSSLSCWAWCWWGINSRLQIANAWRLPPATKKSSESNWIRSARQRAWVLDLEASSRREGISTKTSLAQSLSWKKWNANIHSFLVWKRCLEQQNYSELRGYHYSNIYQTPTGKLLQSVTWSARLAGLFSCSKHHTLSKLSWQLCVLVFALIQNRYVSWNDGISQQIPDKRACESIFGTRSILLEYIKVAKT